MSLRHAVRINGFTGIALTKLDVLDGMDKLKVCVGYEYKAPAGSCSKKSKACKFKDFPQQANVLEKCVPVYKEFEGWTKSTKGVTKLKDLPKQARTYIDYISDTLNVDIDIISTGQKRSETMIVKNPFTKSRKR